MYIDAVKDSGEIILFLTDDKGKHLTAFHPYCRGDVQAATTKDELELALQASPEIVAEETNSYVQHHMVAGDKKWAIGPCVDRASGKRIGDRLRGYFNG